MSEQKTRLPLLLSTSAVALTGESAVWDVAYPRFRLRSRDARRFFLRSFMSSMACCATLHIASWASYFVATPISTSSVSQPAS